MKQIKAYTLGLVLASITLLITSCGGGSSSATAGSTSTTITGSVFAAPVAGATVVVLNSNGTTTNAGPVTTLGDGTYSVAIPNASLASDLIISSNSGTFDDEATGGATLAGTMAAYVEAGTLTSGSKVALDPSSTIVSDLVTRHSMTFGEAKSIFADAFGYTPDTSIVPKNAHTSGLDTAQRLAGLRAMAFSQMTKDLGLTSDEQFDLLAAIADDLVDGTLDGNSGLITLPIGTMPEDIGNRFGCSLITLLTNTAVNLTGLQPSQIGFLPFAKVALTPTYKVEYLPGVPANATAGKTTFKIRVTTLSDGLPATGLTVSLEPMMHMSDTMKHATPMESVVNNLDGTYSCTIYYTMSSMMSGMSQGYWELKVVIGGETATFYPYVNMAMDTASATLYGQSDIVSGMSGTEYRRYYLFKENAISAATPTLNLYIVHDEGMKMSFLPAFNSAVLSDPTGTITTMTVRASTDKANWSTPTVDSVNGHWSISGISGLVSGVTTTIYVELIVNAEQKTTTGTSPAGTNSYASFTVTPKP